MVRRKRRLGGGGAGRKRRGEGEPGEEGADWADSGGSLGVADLNFNF